MNRHILIIDSDELLINQLSTSLALEGNDVTIYTKEKDVVWGKNPFDIILLGIDLPGVEGLEDLRLIAEKTPCSEIVLMTAFPSVETAVEAMHYRASDYILKPTDADTVLTCIESIIKRIEASKGYDDVGFSEKMIKEPNTGMHFIVLGNGITFDYIKRIINSDDTFIRLTPTESKLLRALLESVGKLIEPRQLIFQTQGYETNNQEASVILRPLISRLRQKLSKIPAYECRIINVRGNGYMVECNKSIMKSFSTEP